MKNKHITNFKLFLNENNTNNIDIEKLVDFFENEDFNVYLFEQDNMQCAELEKWTKGGVDMIITLMPFTKEKFIEWVNDFNVDDEIDLHRQDSRYKADFTISESLTDFTDFHNHLKEVVEKLNQL